MAASSYRRGGWFVQQDAEDIDDLRLEFIRRFGSPARTIALGASYGGLVTAQLVEMFGVSSNGALNYHGTLPFCGVVAGTRKHSYLLLDSRAVYQYYCNNHPRPEEPNYPLWMGLPADVTMSQSELAERINECTGIELPPERRSESQRRNLANILSVLRRPETDFVIQMWNGATIGLQNIAHEVLADVGNPFPNRDIFYTGSDDDETLNSSVARYESERKAVSLLSADGDLTGEVAVPVLTMHGIGDARVFVEQESAYRDEFERAGTLDHLLQVYVDTAVHCGYSVPEFQAVFHSLIEWIETSIRPTGDDTATACERYRHELGGECRFNPSYEPAPYESRVYPRTPESS